MPQIKISRHFSNTISCILFINHLRPAPDIVLLPPLPEFPALLFPSSPLLFLVAPAVPFLGVEGIVESFLDLTMPDLPLLLFP
jgi:hypothetical protein